MGAVILKPWEFRRQLLWLDSGNLTQDSAIQSSLAAPNEKSFRAPRLNFDRIVLSTFTEIPCVETTTVIRDFLVETVNRPVEFRRSCTAANMNMM
jgi:hypothetical protein